MTYDFLAELRAVGALKSGHFLLSSGRHSAEYVEKFELLKDPRATSRACTEIINMLGEYVDVDLVAGPTTGGILLAFEIARQLGLPAAYAERVTSGSSEREFSRGATPAEGARVLVVDDVMTTGGSVRETLAAVEACGAKTVAVAVLVDRSGGNVTFECPLLSLAQLDIETWESGDVPAWLNEIPIQKPGTTAIQSMRSTASSDASI